MVYGNDFSGGDDYGRYGGAGSQIPKTELDHIAQPPAYASTPGAAGLESQGATPRSRWDPRSWGLKTKLAVAAAVVVAIIVIVVGSVEGTKANRYPNYSKLNYTLKETYSGTSFFDQFNYYSGYDPAAGFVHYVDQAGSEYLNLTYASEDSAVIKVDTSNVDASTGRRSVRITSKNTYNSGLFIFDILHSPYGCGTWPALWLSDPDNWPTNGEIDVLEANNAATTGNQMTLHTTNGCKMNVKRKETGKVLATNCWNETNSNEGCGVQGKPATYGEALNNNGGGIYATELRDAGIRVWFFPRSSIPNDISDANSTPDPSTWGTALADFPSTDCDISSHFRNQSIIANIDLCGQLAGLEKFYTVQSGCPGTCTDYVANNPTAFTNAYWEFKSFKVYQAS
ncbi:concanavalin A-like lectin/glucanase domain-containing protein [Paecilomyces variotii]|uniref:endo-1,3(4)-beta-glucanase n=1 Tax=Byssochlamys spectabilis TaxID=264951 RepID=A0A443HJR8_BYSSP|nr:concanavalin A-like lectin/glucanase domain-containing protein [Paecilomyces variotii]KAJ9205273.1 CAZyme family GH16 [Paecilomyces variotii]KAJ9280214.1 CAZyme family GH16 [Paecilomyces variotii]KAJ9343028.1 CAZyme family GH16 [Paecilomyces variotii]KAJ9359770.1 CAZyme family GH16 [Paecilomyces variotii]KAJ9361280.1 CAZyme family GH16 [Paecilomyces variotii]